MMRSGPTLCMAAALACAAPQPDRRGAGSPATAASGSASWRDAYDLDGDDTNDRIFAEATGGAHCCYHLGVALSSTGLSTVFAFNLDGGYPRGLDLSQPDKLTVRTRPGGLPEIVYQIETYNGEPQPLDPIEAKRWGIHSNRIALCFAGGRPQARDEAPNLPPCAR